MMNGNSNIKFQIRVYLLYQNWLWACANVKKSRLFETHAAVQRTV